MSDSMRILEDEDGGNGNGRTTTRVQVGSEIQAEARKGEFCSFPTFYKRILYKTGKTLVAYFYVDPLYLTLKEL